MSTKIIFAGGGTAGHVEPALAVASWLRTSRPDWQYSFVGTKKGLENKLVPQAGFELLYIPKVVMPRELTPSIFIWPVQLLIAIWQGVKICRDADLVIGLVAMHSHLSI